MNYINNIFEKVLKLFTLILNFIKSPNAKFFIFMYLILICISMFFLSKYRNVIISKKNTEYIKQNTNRQKAIENFNNYNKQIAEKLNKECSIAITNSIVYNKEKISTLPDKNGIFYFNNLERLIEEYVSKNILGDIKTKKPILDNYYLSLDINLDNFCNKEFDKIKDIITKIISMKPETIQELKYNNQEKLKDTIIKINENIKNVLVSDIQFELRRIMGFDETRDSLLINETPIPKIITNEIHERLYVKIYKDILQNNIFTDFCKLRSDIMKLEAELKSSYDLSYDTISSKENIISGLTEKITSKKREYIKINQKYTLYLICLEAFSNTQETKKIMTEELKKMSISNIQPANENSIDNIMLSKSKIYGKLSSTPKLLVDTENNIIIDQNDRIAEDKLTSQYSKANTNYEKDLKNMNGDTRIDPISIFNNVEKSAISFLESIRGGNNNKTNDELFKQRFDNDKAVRGTFLANDDMNLNGNNSNYKTVNTIKPKLDDNNNDNNNSIIEGFSNLSNKNKKTTKTTNNKSDNNTNNLLDNLGSQFLSISQNIIDNELIKNIINIVMKLLKLENIKSSEQLGVLLISVSVLLFFIDISS